MPSPPVVSPIGSSRRPVLLLLAGLLVLCAIVYSPAGRLGFISIDDQAYVAQNAHVQAGFTVDGLHYAFTTTAVGGWNPLVWLSFFLDEQLFHAAPGSIHVENVVFHAVTGVLLWIFLTRATGVLCRSWIVAALFVCHPMHVESVAWIAERKDVLSTPFLIAALLSYLKYCQASPGPRRWFYYSLMILLFILSLMTKAMGVTLPLLLILLDFWPLKRIPAGPGVTAARARWFAEKIPIFAMAFFLSAISIFAQRASRATDAATALPMMDRISNAIVCYVIYAIKLCVPTGLVAFYPHPGSRPMAQVTAAAGLLIFITWLAVRNRIRRPYIIVGWLWFVIALLPVIGIMQIGGQAMADRYSYLPSVGFFIVVVWLATDLATRIGLDPRYQNSRWILATTVLAVLATLAAVGRQQLWYWKNDQTLFTHCVEITGPNPVATYVLAGVAYNRGDFQSAVVEFTKVVEMDPGNDKAMEYLGDLWIKADLKKATDYYHQALLLKPGKIDYRLAYAAALASTDDLISLESAEKQLHEILRIDPANPAARAGMADVQARISRLKLQP